MDASFRKVPFELSLKIVKEKVTTSDSIYHEMQAVWQWTKLSTFPVN
jgi:hypothetical protein